MTKLKSVGQAAINLLLSRLLAFISFYTYFLLHLGTMEGGAVTVLQPPEDAVEGLQHSSEGTIEQFQARKLFREFFRNFRLGNVFIYREALMRQWNCGQYFVEVDLFHVQEFNRSLFNNLQVTFWNSYFFV